ncbi:hypothetical protein BT67DRAFT_436522 [Trichocladium antarcticum]|uniref:Flo11 n=1 Tax=Trichocladium antarcticum TaxID=1450529 RepID=A0AAN6UEC7_9PEZI|nr:hypothetical protein BT67DRAFT_436522 [Trichocladium antarcticum]
MAASPPQRMPSRSRTLSISSDRPSTIAHSLMSAPLSVSPGAAFIAASAASQIVTNDHDSHAETWYGRHGIQPSGDAAAVSPAALQLVNNFLDQLLFNFLSVARSTLLSMLRPAVSEVLKPKLAEDAINQADEELREYLGGDDEDAGQPQPRDRASSTDWDLELAWKRTRLRCMVYSSLGDMEEEDEDYYTEQGHLDTGLDDDPSSEVVSPAVAIFLTSIMEFLAEQALIIASQAAYHRMRVRHDKELQDGVRSPTSVADRIVVEELDMERVALDRTLGRLWRGWKKKIRSPVVGSADRLARSHSGDSMHAAFGRHLRSPSSAAEPAVPASVPAPVLEDLVAAAIPLPLGSNDVAEIEVPGLAFCSDDESESDEDDDADAEEQSKPVRPKSLMILPSSGASKQPVPTVPSKQPPVSDSGFRKRANSQPTPAPPRYISPTKPQGVEPVDAVLPDSSPAGRSETTRVVSDAATSTAVEENRPTSDGPAPVRRGPLYGSVDETLEDGARDDDDDDEVSIEEPRFVRSSRISILGRSPSLTSTEHGSPISINTNLPDRTPSIHSVRLIEVSSPRSPVVGSRRSSVGVAESTHHPSPPLSSRTRTPPVLDLGASHPSRPGLAAGLCISEAGRDVDHEYMVSPMTPVTPAIASLPVSREQYESAPGPSSSSSDRIREPLTPAKPVTKVTMIPRSSSPPSTASTASGAFIIESMPVLPEGVESEEDIQADNHGYRPSPRRQSPVVPERNAGRQAVANTSAHRRPATIGQVSVERSPTRSPTEPSSSRPYDSVAGPTRQQHASGSPSSTKLKAVRTSDEVMHARIDVVRDFEELIQSDQTIQYTLTPENMRDMDSTRTVGGSSPVIPVKTRKSEESRHNGARSRPSSAPRSSPSGASPAMMDAHPVNKNFPSSTSKHGGVVPRSTPPLPSKARTANSPQAREARLPRESLAEFAEFIRSTGPPSGSTASANASLRLGARNPASVSKTSIEPRRGSAASNPNRPRLLAREASVDYKADNSDLIDFIRRGPPSTAGNPRIPKAVAPFRTTMDSDQMSGAVGGRAVDAQLHDFDFRNSQASTDATEHSVPPSVQSSINSHSALLARSKPVSYDAVEDDMPMPKRKTRRVRDPYAIDFSDEEEMEDDDELTPMAPRRVQTREESLIDFLNNCAPPPPPPPEPPAQSFNLAQTTNKPKKKASAPSLMARLTRRESGKSNNPQPPASAQIPASSRSLSSRASSGRGGHVPIQVTAPAFADQYTPQNRGGSSKAAAPIISGGGPAPAAGARVGVAMKKFQAREAVPVVTSHATSDLADFLKHSGPPPGIAPMVHQFPGPVERDETSSISKVFGRRKKPSYS